jgi:hypothetical protein
MTPLNRQMPARFPAFLAQPPTIETDQIFFAIILFRSWH